MLKMLRILLEPVRSVSRSELLLYVLLGGLCLEAWLTHSRWRDTRSSRLLPSLQISSLLRHPVECVGNSVFYLFFPYLLGLD
jgi:hypothetical protein